MTNLNQFDLFHYLSDVQEHLHRRLIEQTPQDSELFASAMRAINALEMVKEQFIPDREEPADPPNPDEVAHLTVALEHIAGDRK